MGEGVGMSDALEPLTVTVKRYECPFCHRRHSAKTAARKHMARCWLNPAVRSCKSCANLAEEPDGEPCEAGRPCPCNNGYRICEATGKEFGRDDTFPVTNCPLWSPRATGCTPSCWTPVNCPTCGNQLPPRGRSMPPEMGITDCCDEARMNSKINPRHLWNEEEASDA